MVSVPGISSDFTEENMTSMSVHGKNVPYAMDIALCNMYPNIEIELIAPKDDREYLCRIFERAWAGNTSHCFCDTARNV